jgi:glutathione S-transferase
MNFMNAYKKLFKHAIAPNNIHKAPAIKRKLVVFVVAYSRHMQYLRLDKLSPVRFRLFLNKFNLFIMNSFTPELGQAWQQLVRQTNKEALQATNKKEAALKKHDARIAFLRSLTAYLPGENNTGATGAGA